MNKFALFQEAGFDRLADLRRENEHLKKESIQKNGWVLGAQHFKSSQMRTLHI